MENQRPNINQLRRNNTKPVGLWQIFMPIAVNYGIVLLTEFGYIAGVTIRVIINYVRNTPELSALMTNTELSYSEMVDAINGFFTEDTTEWVMEQVIADFTTNIAFVSVLSGIMCIPIFIWMFTKDKNDFLYAKAFKRTPEVWWKYCFVVVGSVSVCIGLNNLINLSQLASLSSSYQDSSEFLYSVSFPLQLIGWGIVSPIAEELIFRGIIYNRLKMMVKPLAAMLWSALIFGAYHGNIVQGLYAGLCGLMFVWLYERYGSVKAPIISHVALNITAIIMTQYDVFLWLFSEPLRLGIITVASSTFAATIYVLIQNNTTPYFELPNFKGKDDESSNE